MEIKGFRELTLVDWDGVMAAVVFAGGCNFRCIYCHNHEIAFCSDRVETIGEDVVFGRLSAMRQWIDGVVVSGGEPCRFGSDLAAFLGRLKTAGFRTKVFTNGSFPGVLAQLLDLRLVDAVSMDIKHRPERYREVSGVGGREVTKHIKHSIDMLLSSSIETEFRMTVVKGIHTAADISAIRTMVSPRRLIVQNVSDADIPACNRLSVVPFTESEFELFKHGVLNNAA